MDASLLSRRLELLRELAEVEREIRAGLISAAPDLYEALKNLVDAGDAASEACGPREVDWLEAATVQARAALAKAEGRS